MDFQELAGWYLAVLQDALAQAEKHSLIEIDWILSDEEGPFSFLTITRVLGMNPERIRYTVRRCIRNANLNNALTMELGILDDSDNDQFKKKCD